MTKILKFTILISASKNSIGLGLKNHFVCRYDYRQKYFKFSHLRESDTYKGIFAIAS